MESLPKGERVAVNIDGKDILLLWYKTTICGLENRSPAEGAYSEGMLKGRLTQDGCIACPTTDSTFYLSTGDIKEWYPRNVVLDLLTPRKNLPVYPVKVEQDGIYVGIPDNTAVSSTSSSWTGAGPTSFKASLGGSDTSIDQNNVYAIEPTVYVEGTAPGSYTEDEPVVDIKAKPATVITAIVAVGIVAIAGTVTAIFYEQYVGLGLFWLFGFGAVALFIQKNTRS